MKLFNVMIAASAIEAKRPTRNENMIKWFQGGFDSDKGAIRTTKCPPLELPENAMDVVYHQDENPNVEAIAEAMCEPGWFPDLSNGQKLKTKCKLMKDGEYRWIRPLPKCVTCDVQEPTQAIKSGEPNLNVFCTHKGHNFEKHCQLRCIDDRLRVAHNIIKDKSGKKKTQKRANIDCRCKKGNCQWTSHNKAGLALDGFKCKAEGELKPVQPIDCSIKEPECAVVTPKVEQLNSWVCRNCFRIRAYYKFRQFNIKDFDNQDYMDITFDEQVFWIKHSHPVESAEDIGNNTWRVRFSKFATFSNKEMDFSAELRAVSPKIPGLTIAKTCPCAGN